MSSPYDGVSPDGWLEVTKELVQRHPLSAEELVEVVLASWNSIFESRLGTAGFRIGMDIFPKPQTMGFFLHELVPLEIQAKHPGDWRPEASAEDKDIVYIPDNFFSVELKTSSNARHIFGNRSYAQQSSGGKKSKSGYYLTVNFEKFETTEKLPKIRIIRFGWLDATDWIGQKAATVQQARLSPETYATKFLVLHPPPT